MCVTDISAYALISVTHICQILHLFIPSDFSRCELVLRSFRDTISHPKIYSFDPAVRTGGTS
jgi:hypothetical protein